MLISEILDSNPHLREIDYNKCISQDEIETIAYAIFPYVGFSVGEVTGYEIALFHKAMQLGLSEVDF